MFMGLVLNYLVTLIVTLISAINSHQATSIEVGNYIPSNYISEHTDLITLA